MEGLSIVNIDPTAAIAPSADHILWSRIGWPYQPADLIRAVEEDRAVFEWAGFYRPMQDLPLLLPEMRRRAERRLGSLGVARSTALKQPVEPLGVGPVGEEAVIEGVDGSWRVDPTLLEPAVDRVPRTALLSPFDRLVFDRVRAREIFGFEYIVEMYKPAAKRRWGYFALPVLHGDRLVGKLDAAVDRRAGVLRVNAIHEDVDFDTDITEDVHAEIRDLAAWLGVDVVGIDGS